MKRFLPHILIGASLLLGAPLALAAGSDNPPPPPPDAMGGPPGGMHGGHHRHMFEDLDLNKDGKITKDEAAQVGAKRFAEIAGHASEITEQQFVNFHADRMRKRLGDMFARLDTNHDGKLSEAEFNADHEKMFDFMDRNHDGVITKDEMRPHGGGHWQHHDKDDGQPE